MVTLARAERWTELLDFAREAQGAETRSAWIVVATAVLSGIDEAIAEAGRQTAVRAARDKLLSASGLTLLQVRRYREASALLRAGAQSAPQGAAAATAQADMVGRCRRHEELSTGGDTPEDLVRRFFVDILLNEDTDKLAEYLETWPSRDEDRSAATRTVRGPLQGLRSAIAGAGISVDGIADIVLSMAEWHTEGSETAGYKASMRVSVPGDTRTLDFFMRRVGGALKIVTVGNEVTPIGRVALAYLGAGDTESARRWLTWAHDELPSARADPPGGSAVRRVLAARSAGG